MREKLLAVCDKDERYLQGMQEYFQRKGTADFQIVTFTALEQIISYSQNKPIEILLIGENVYTEEAPNARAGKIYLLSENGHNGNAEYPSHNQISIHGRNLCTDHGRICAGYFL